MSRDIKLFSSKNRAEIIKNLPNERYDLIVIGGGITGAGIALDAASRGIKTLLIEKRDFAEGTSSRSTKLVHGGLRYLEHLELGLVREVGREREIVHTNAAHIVLPEKMILPITEDGSLGEFTTSLALYVYDFLAGVKKEEHRKMLSRDEVTEKIPLIDSPMLKSGALYYEYKTDDSRLTIEVLKKAIEYEAMALNYCRADSFLYENDKLVGLNAIDEFTGEKKQLFAKNIINATGPWADFLRKQDKSLKGKRIRHSKGVHIVVEKERFPLNHAMYFDTGDNRMVFAIPRGQIVYIGTTDTDYEGELENPEVHREDVEYLLKAVNRISSELTDDLQFKDVKSAWAGLRPLIHEEGKAPSELSRKDEVFVSDSGLISITGGKLTGYRIMAKSVVKIVMNRLVKNEGKDKVKCQTKNMRLAGGEFPFYPDAMKLVEYADKKYDEAKQTGISVADFKNLFYRYGMNIDKITDKAYDFYNEKKNTRKAWLKAEIWYGVNYESVVKLSDFFIRRTGMIFFEIDKIAELADDASLILKDFLNKSEEKRLQELAELQLEINRATNFKPKKQKADKPE